MKPCCDNCSKELKTTAHTMINNVYIYQCYHCKAIIVCVERKDGKEVIYNSIKDFIEKEG